jgi:hypothetical protein
MTGIGLMSAWGYVGATLGAQMRGELTANLHESFMRFPLALCHFSAPTLRLSLSSKIWVDVSAF